MMDLYDRCIRQFVYRVDLHFTSVVCIVNKALTNYYKQYFLQQFLIIIVRACVHASWSYRSSIRLWRLLCEGTAHNQP